jgi:hypothetical protein
MQTIGSQGFVTMRVEKSGVGDSQGEPCAWIGYSEEIAGYRAALAGLRSNPAVDPNRIFLLGISLGGCSHPSLRRTGSLPELLSSAPSLLLHSSIQAEAIASSRNLRKWMSPRRGRRSTHESRYFMPSTMSTLSTTARYTKR